jgi:carboxyl-terminal processing protease
MNSIRSITLVAALALSVFAAPSSQAATNFGQVAMHVAYMLQNHHYSHQDFDDDVSAKLLDNYLDLLDFKHVFFTQKDVDSFKAKFASTLDDHVLMRNVAPATEIYDVYRMRVEERVKFIEETLENHNFTFDSDRTVEIKRDDVPWPKDEADADQVWLNILEESLLQQKLVDMAKAEDEAEKAAKRKDKAEAEEDTTAEAAGEKKEESAELAKADADEEEELTAEQRVLKDYERLLESINENDQEDVVNYFLSCLATAYDPHTEYMSQNEMDNFNIQMKHSLVGIGALLGLEDDVAQIQGIVVGGPADGQGELQLNDRITAVAQGELDFVEVKFMKLQKIVDMIRGEKGSTVRLKVTPADDPGSVKIISIVRGEVELKEKLANAQLISTPKELGSPMRVGWINLASFYADMEGGTVSTTVDVQRLLIRLIDEGIDGLVLDLRGNGGGSLDEAIKLTGLFVPAGPVVQAKDWRGNVTWKESENERALYDGPMIVLTDKASASASEILAAALQDYRRAIIMGDDSTFGKGTVQTILPVERYMPFFSDKSRAGALKVTIQKFYRIAGGSTQLKGVEPDLKLPSIRNVLDIGEASAENPLPYDEIPPRPYATFRKDPFPVEQLQKRLESRISQNPEFQWIADEAGRLKERIDKNTISLNEAKREAERLDNKARREAQKEKRAGRVEKLEANLAEGEGFKVYHLTLDNVDQEELVLESDFTREQSTGMRVAAEEEGDEGSRFPYDLEPTKLEAINVLRDMIELDKGSPTTASAEEKKAD